MHIHCFTFNPFSENTYIVYNDDGSAWLIDPGCCNGEENASLSAFIKRNNLTVVRHILTHAHIDHILGCSYVYREFGLVPTAHLLEKPIFDSAVAVSKMYGIPYTAGPSPDYGLYDGAILEFGQHGRFRCIHCPGHSPGSICFYEENLGWLIGGDVLFEGSIGRTDLPGGDYDTLIRSIKERLLVLPHQTKVFPGHGNPTTIIQEKANNPFLI